MPSVGVTKSDILTENNFKQYMFTVSQGVHSYLPGFLEGENSLALTKTLDRIMEAYRYYNNMRLDKRHVDTDNIDCLNGDELNDRLNMLGVPYTPLDNNKSKKIRAKDWWYHDRGNGDAGTVKAVIYNLIGSGAFINTEGALTDVGKTSRIGLEMPFGLSTWAEGDVVNPISDIDWGQFGVSYSGVWSSVDDLGKNELDIRIKYDNLVDYYKWKQDYKKAELYYIINKVKPAGLIYTITDNYDGALSFNLKAWLELDRAVSDKTGNFTPTGTNISYQTGLGTTTARFSGNSKIEITNAELFPAAQGSVYGWIKVDAQVSGSNQYMFTFGSDDHKIYVADNTDDFGFSLENAGGVYTHSGTVNFGEWHFVGMQWSGTSYQYVLDNTVFHSGTLTGSLTSTSGTLTIGDRASSNYLTGNIRNLRFYDRYITTAERGELYSGIAQFT